MDVSGDNYLLNDLQNGYSYAISLVAISQHLPSEHTSDMVMLGEHMYNTL